MPTRTEFTGEPLWIREPPEPASPQLWIAVASRAECGAGETYEAVSAKFLEYFAADDFAAALAGASAWGSPGSSTPTQSAAPVA